MKRLSIVVLAITASTASAGTIGFDAPLQIVDPSITTLASFSLSITDADTPTYIGLTAVIGSDDLTLLDWAWGPAVAGICPGGDCGPPTTTGFYPSNFKIGFAVEESAVPIGEILGTLTVDVTGLAPGDYTVVIDPDRDTGFSAISTGLVPLSTGFQEEPLSGFGTIRVVPEPATVLLLGIGSLFSLARRRTRQ